MSSPTPEIVRAFHAAYVRETGLPISLGFDRQRAWHELLKLEFGDPPAPLAVADLLLVIRYLKAGIARQERNPGCLRFRNLIEQPDYFEEELAMARKVLRPRPKSKTEAVSTAHPEGGSITRLEDRQPQSEPQSAGEEVSRFMAEYRRRRPRNQNPEPL